MTDIVSTADKLACVERELAMRKRVYERLVDEGKMSAGKAAHEIACIEAMVQDYAAWLDVLRQSFELIYKDNSDRAAPFGPPRPIQREAR